MYYFTLGQNKDWCFTCEFENLIVKAKEGNTPLSPIRILSHLENIGSHLDYGKEEDAHEFLRCVTFASGKFMLLVYLALSCIQSLRLQYIEMTGVPLTHYNPLALRKLP